MKKISLQDFKLSYTRQDQQHYDYNVHFSVLLTSGFQIIGKLSTLKGKKVWVIEALTSFSNPYFGFTRKHNKLNTIHSCFSVYT